MNVVLEKAAAKIYKNMNAPLKGRIKAKLKGLEKEPPEGDIKKLLGRDDYRLRVGGFRILFRKEPEGIVVTNIAPRGGAYKD